LPQKLCKIGTFVGTFVANFVDQRLKNAGTSTKFSPGMGEQKSCKSTLVADALLDKIPKVWPVRARSNLL
jgi:hypothetical protein